jgi:class 3 adenylate cyclase
LLLADLSGYTALTETHGALRAAEIVERFGRLAETSLEPGVAIVDRVGDEALFACADTLAIVRTALRLRGMVASEPEFPAVRAAIHRGAVLARDGPDAGRKRPRRCDRRPRIEALPVLLAGLRARLRRTALSATFGLTAAAALPMGA